MVSNLSHRKHLEFVVEVELVEPSNPSLTPVSYPHDFNSSVQTPDVFISLFYYKYHTLLLHLSGEKELTERRHTTASLCLRCTKLVAGAECKDREPRLWKIRS